MKDPWLEASAKYQIGQVVSGTILKVNPFGLFVKLDDEIHGLAHVSQLSVSAKDKITDLYQMNEVRDFEVVSISPSEHRLGLKLASAKATAEKTEKSKAKTTKKDKKDEAESEEKEETKEDLVEKKEKKAKATKKD